MGTGSLLDGLPGPARARAEEDPLAVTALVEAVSAARAAWPAVDVPAPELVRHLGERLPAEGSFSTALAALRVTDLYLACACARGDSAAIQAFEERYFGEVASACARVQLALGVDEARQALRERLFVGAAGRPPRVAQYGGLGDLRSWVRVAATRVTLNLAMRGPKEPPLADHADKVLAEEDDPELQYLKRRYHDEFKEAFAQAAAALSDRDRTLLRFAVVDRLTVDAIGAVYEVHRATAARWVAAARARLEEEVRRLLTVRLGLADTEIDSIARLIRSQLDFSVSRHLAEDEAAG